MNNLYTEIYVPALGLTMDLLIPVHVTVGQAIQLIAEIVYKKEQVAFDAEHLMLYDPERQTFLDGEDHFGSLPLQDACHLVVV